MAVETVGVADSERKDGSHTLGWRVPSPPSLERSESY